MVYYKDTVEFFFEARNECKNFWKKCVEHHGFFRCAAVKKMPRQKTRVISRGSSFRYSGRTQKQIVDYVRDNYVKRQPFQRSQSFRQTSTSHSGLSGVSGDKFTSSPHSVQPPIPIGTPTSRSCGSVTLSEGSTPSPTHADANQPQTPLGLDTAEPITNGNGQHPDELDKSAIYTPNGELDGRSKQEDWPVTTTGFFSTHATSCSSIFQPSNDNDDSISYESYQLDEQILLASPDKQCPLAEPEGESVCEDEDEYESEDETVHETFKTSDERGGESISYKLHRRQLEAKPRTGLTLDLVSSKTKPVKPPRVMVEVDHSKNAQTSPTLYVRSRVGMPSSSDEAPRQKVLSYVAVHDLPPICSYSSQDDSAPDEQEDIKRLSWKKRKKEEIVVQSQMTDSNSNSNSNLNLNLNFIDDSSEEVEIAPKQDENDVKMEDDEDILDEDLRIVEDEELKIVEDGDLEMQNVELDEKMEIDADRLFIKDESECMFMKDDDFTFKDVDNYMENGLEDECSNGGPQDLDDDDLDPLFPMRTLSRISEHSTSDSTPSETAVNKSSMACSSSSEEMVTEGPPNWDNLKYLEAEIYDTRLDLPDIDDEDSSKVVETTYYLEINSDQREELEKLEKAGAPIFRSEMDSTETEETSSAENDTLCEELSLHEGLDDIEEIASDAEQYEGINVRIRIGPEKSPKSLIRYEGQEDLSSDLNISKKRHRSELQLQVSRGEIREDTDTSRSGDEDDFSPLTPTL
uniref:FERM adjacent domain-containing protein n=1 Tax=Strigamia maritima TaxID=126957 RepID=T1JN93_STRMM